ncbi:type II toxin-antitoxin system RelE/ParE family toxin [Marinobacter sp. OP 3.4]|uniref:type II toxin-antitoxin system RelE/ParE family toxin n=1 Tax=Marinobacter sp. OP 3.4 TaxID=3076501 RepID=UPI002E21AB09
MEYTFHPAAEAELNEAVDYYESIQPGLGIDFSQEAYKATIRAVEHPKAWSIIREPIRRSLLKRFPYGILYSETTAGIHILAVMNLHREPFYWLSRQ